MVFEQTLLILFLDKPDLIFLHTIEMFYTQLIDQTVLFLIFQLRINLVCT